MPPPQPVGGGLGTPLVSAPQGDEAPPRTPAPDAVVQQTLFWGSCWILVAPVLIWGLPPRTPWHWVAGACALCSSTASLSHWYRWEHRSWRRMLDWPLALVIVLGHVVSVLVDGYGAQDRIAVVLLGLLAGVSMGAHRHSGYDLDWGLLYRYFGVWTVVFPYWNQAGGKMHSVWQPFGRIALIVAWVTAVYVASAVVSWRVRWPHLPTGLATPGLPERLPALAVRHTFAAVSVVSLYRVGASSRAGAEISDWEVAWMASSAAWAASGTLLTAWMWKSGLVLRVQSPVHSPASGPHPEPASGPIEMSGPRAPPEEMSGI